MEVHGSGEDAAQVWLKELGEECQTVEGLLVCLVSKKRGVRAAIGIVAFHISRIGESWG